MSNIDNLGATVDVNILNTVESLQKCDNTFKQGVFPPPLPQFFVANFKTRLLGDKLKSV